MKLTTPEKKFLEYFIKKIKLKMAIEETIREQAFQKLKASLEDLEEKNEMLKKNLNEMGKSYSVYEEIIHPAYTAKLFQIYAKFFEVNSEHVVFNLNSKIKSFEGLYRK